MTYSDEQVMAYVDGELDAPERGAFEHALQDDADLAARVERQRRLRARLQQAFAPTLVEPIPDRFMAALHSTTSDAGAAPLPRLHPFRRPRADWLALAASLVIGVLVGVLASRSERDELTASTPHGLVARGRLADALDQQIASTQQASANVQVGLTFVARSGEYCRTFQASTPTAVSGLACRGGSGWLVQVLDTSAPGREPPGEYRPAAAALSPLVRAAIQDRIAGMPLDAASEAAARNAQWRRH
ncbi:MAG TPA: hypothetical protein VF277_00520 [Steroidobacteraceae bacterium]